MDDPPISARHAYLAMFTFLDQAYQRTGSDTLGGMLGEMSLLTDGNTADPAIWHRWLRCVQDAMDGKVDAMLTLGSPRL